ncbi:MAG TPA: hypothetical protein VMV29_00295, partial [Ktedonobacterales bacterium]|nr:hypothetical protein [Ktedonobacterales bacterium]
TIKLMLTWPKTEECASTSVFACQVFDGSFAGGSGLVCLAGVGCGATPLPCEHVVVVAYPAIC